MDAITKLKSLQNQHDFSNFPSTLQKYCNMVINNYDSYGIPADEEKSNLRNTALKSLNSALAYLNTLDLKDKSFVAPFTELKSFYESELNIISTLNLSEENTNLFSNIPEEVSKNFESCEKDGSIQYLYEVPDNINDLKFNAAHLTSILPAFTRIKESNIGMEMVPHLDSSKESPSSSQENSKSSKKPNFNEHEIDQTQTMGSFQDWMEKVQLKETDVSGNQSNCLIHAILQHATGLYKVKEFKAAQSLREMIQIDEPIDVIGPAAKRLVEIINQKMKLETGSEIIFYFIQSNNEGLPFHYHNLGSRDGHPAIIWHQGTHYVSIIPQPSSDESILPLQHDFQEKLSINTASDHKDRSSPIKKSFFHCELDAKEVYLESNDILWDQDALSSNTMIIENAYVSNIGEDEEGPFIEVKLKKNEYDQIHLRALHLLNDANVCIKLSEEFLPTSHADIDFLEKANQKIDKSAKDYENHLEKIITKSENLAANEEIMTKLDQISTMRDSLDIQSKTLQKRREKWDQDIKNFYIKTENLLQISRTLINQEAHQEAQRLYKECIDNFEQLRIDNPSSIKPYMPFFLYLSPFIPQKDLMSLTNHSPHTALIYAMAVIIYRLSVKKTDPQSINSLAILSFLKEAFPDDIFIKALDKANEDKVDEGFIESTHIDCLLKMTVNRLIKGDKNSIEEAIRLLVNHKKYLIGFSNIYEYLALAHAFNGDLDKAEEIINKASNLPRLVNCSEINNDKTLMKIISQPLSLMPGFTATAEDEDQKYAQEEDSDFIKYFIKLMISPSQNKIINFIKLINKALGIRSVDLSIIYLTFTWIERSFLLGKNDKIKELDKCATQLAVMSYCLIKDQDAECFKYITQVIKDGKPYYKIAFYDVFTIPLNDTDTPTINFNRMALDKNSINILADKLAIKFYDFLRVVIENEAHSNHLEMKNLDPKSLRLPRSSSLFLKILYQGLKSNELDKQNASITLLEKYYEIKPYPISSNILEWIEFYIFYLGHRKNLINSPFKPFYYDQNKEKKNLIMKLNKKIYETRAQKLIKIIDNVFIIRNRQSKLDQFQNPQTKEYCIPGQSKNFYELLEFSFLLYGWRKNESFEKWRDRLEEGRFNFLLFPYLESQKKTNSEEETEEETFNFELKSKLQFLFLQKMEIFWKYFLNTTIKKNSYISKGGNEEDLNQEKNWIETKEMGLKKWLELVRSGKAEGYNNYKLLTSQEQTNLKEIIQSKHKHQIEFNNLKKEFSAKYGIIKNNTDDLATVLAAELILRAETKRSDISNIYADSEEVARNVYRILINVAIDRLTKQLIIEQGPDHWEIKKSHPIIQLLFTKLKSLEGAFHGPEEHILGKGPLESHYNAAILDSNFNFINTHIYFSKENNNSQEKK
ncbi:MAG: hypothetical protein QRY72_00085 [Candidatus Rhabdochlamydia sp.]